MEFQLDRTLEVLRATPSTLRSLLAGLSDEWIASTRGAGTWSPFDILGHLIHGEETDWIPRLRTILEHGETRPFQPFDRFAQFDRSKGLTLVELLRRFAELRSRNIATLERLSLTPAQLALRGTHPEFGSVTAKQLLATWAVHDLAHLAQISRTLAAGYREEVGPWRAYLSVLSD